MKKNTNKLEKIVIILLFIIIITIGAYFNIGEEDQTGNNVEFMYYIESLLILKEIMN